MPTRSSSKSLCLFRSLARPQSPLLTASLTMGEGQTFSADEFFAQQPPPKELDRHLDQVRAFVEANVNRGRKVVLITVSVPGAPSSL